MFTFCYGFLPIRRALHSFSWVRETSECTVVVKVFYGRIWKYEADAGAGAPRRIHVPLLPLRRSHILFITLNFTTHGQCATKSIAPNECNHRRNCTKSGWNLKRKRFIERIERLRAIPTWFHVKTNTRRSPRQIVIVQSAEIVHGYHRNEFEFQQHGNGKCWRHEVQHKCCTN